MAYFIFNPQTNELDSSDNPTPIRKNLGQQYLNKGGRVGFKDRGSLSLSPEYKKLIDIQNKHRFAPAKTRISMAGEGIRGDQVYPQQDLAEDFEILRNKINNPKKTPPTGSGGIDGREKPLAKQIKKIYAEILEATGRKPYIAEIMEKVTLDNSKTLDNKRVNIKEVLKRANLELTPGMTATSKETRIAKSAESTKAGSRIERVLSGADKENLLADIRKYKSGTRVGPQQTMNIKEFAKYFDEGTADAVISKQINRVANDMGLDFKKVSKAEELAAKKVKYDIKKAGDPNKITPIGTKDMPIHHGRLKGIKLGDKILAISPSWNDIGELDIKTNSVKLQNFEKARNTLGKELLELVENKPKGWERRIKEINFLARRESDKIPKALRGLLYFETFDLETGKLKPIGGNPMRFKGKNKLGANIPFKEMSKKVAKRLVAKGLLPAMVANQMMFGDKYKTWDGPGILSDFPLTPGKDAKQTNEFLGMIGDKLNMAEGGIVPRLEYRDGSMMGDSRGWEKMLDSTDPNVLAKIAAKNADADRKDYEDRQKANADGYKHKSEYKDDESFGIIPAYQADVMKKSFGTKEGLKMTGANLGKGVVETAEWMVEIVPHVFKELHKKGLAPYQSKDDMEKYLKENNNEMNWMDFLSPDLSWGDKTGLSQKADEGLEGLTKRFGEGNVPEGVKSVALGAELAGMIADPFLLYAALPKALKTASAAKFKKIKEASEGQVDMAKRDFIKTVGVAGIMAAIGKFVPDILTGKKVKDVAKVARTFESVQGGMPEWLPQFILKATTQKGALKGLPDKNFIEGASYQVMLPVKRKYYTSTNKDRGIKSDPDGNPITSKGEKDHWGSTGKHSETRTEQVPVQIEVMKDGAFHISWRSTDNYGDDIERSMYYQPGETGTQNYAADELGQGLSKEEVVITEPEFSYTEPDYTSTTPDNPNPDSETYLDYVNDADEIVAAMEEWVVGMTKKDKIKAANEIKLYNRTDEHFGDATGTQNADGDWIEGENNLPIRLKKSMGGVASGPPPLSGPTPQMGGLRSLQPGDIYNKWIK